MPGVLLAVLMFSVPEPPRRATSAIEQAGTAGGAAALPAIPYMRRHWKAYGALLTGMAGVFAMGSLAQWNVALFQRNWGWGIAETGVATGLLILCSAVPGTAVSGWLTTRLQRQGRADAPFRVVTLGLLVFAPAACIAPLMPDAGVALGVFAIAFFGQAVAVAAGPAALVDLTPAPIRSRAVALYWSAISLVGMLIGPASVGALTDAFGNPAALKFSLAIMAAVFAVPALAALVAGRGAYQRSIAAMPRSV
jgi:MFS family permease